MSMNSCVFCSREEQPEVLFETGSLYVMPDKFPLLPGHILIVSKQHLRCHAEAPVGMEKKGFAAAWAEGRPTSQDEATHCVLEGSPDASSPLWEGE